MRTTLVPIVAVRTGSPAPKPSLPIKDIELQVRRFFGTDFKWLKNKSEWLIRGYPIPAEEKCLSCHPSAKKGEPLGYLVYAVGPKRTKS